MTQTPISKAIEQLRKAPTDFNYKDDATLTVEDVLNILTDLLPYEREIIQNSYNQGDEDRYDMSLLREEPKYKNSTDYFTKTFTNGND